MTLHYITQGNL